MLWQGDLVGAPELQVEVPHLLLQGLHLLRRGAMVMPLRLLVDKGEEGGEEGHWEEEGEGREGGGEGRVNGRGGEGSAEGMRGTKTSSPRASDSLAVAQAVAKSRFSSCSSAASFSSWPVG